MPDTRRLPPYAQTSRSYRATPYSVPNFDALLRTRSGSARERRAVLRTLGLSADSHLTEHVDRSSAPDAAILPLAPRRHRGGRHVVEIVRSYGRGYVIPRVALQTSHGPLHGGIAVKGAGLAAWARTNRRWIERETAGHGLVLGHVARDNTANDLWGEFWSRQAGLTCPTTVYCARRGRVYQHARLWRCPYRIWELTAGPFRRGPDVTQPFTRLNWGVELTFALAYRDGIQQRAAACLASLSGAAAAVRVLEETVLDNVVRLTARGIQLSPYTLHLANIGYTGESTGFDRMKGPYTFRDAFQLGVLMAILESWAAISWLGAVAGRRTPRFNAFFTAFQTALAASGAPRPTVQLFLNGDTAADVFTRVNVAGFAVSRDRFLFTRRRPSDVDAYVSACETFFRGLRMVFRNELRTPRDLRRWRRQVHFTELEQLRVWQGKGGDLSQTAFQRLAYEQQALDRAYEAVLFAQDLRGRA